MAEDLGARNFKSYSAHIDKAAFNVTGLIQLAFVYEMLNLVPDADGLNDRQLRFPARARDSS